MVPPAPGLYNDEIMLSSELRNNAGVTNENVHKTSELLSYLHTFEENHITDISGYKYAVLSRRVGGWHVGGGCLRPYFSTKNKKIRAKFETLFIAVPGGDTGGLIPVVPFFGEAYLDDEANDDNFQTLSDGYWSAWFEMDGYDAKLTIQDAGLPPPAPSNYYGDKIVWNVAKWGVEGSGTDDAKVTGLETFDCPFLPALRGYGGHPAFPHLYQKRKSLEEGGPEKWYMKPCALNVHDIHTGVHIKASNCDGKQELDANKGDIWWAHLSTDSDGVPTSLEIVKGESFTTLPFQQEIPKVEHVNPEPGGSSHSDPGVDGQYGSYYIKLFELVEIGGEAKGGGKRLVPRIHHGSDIYWGRWLAKNVGEGCPIYKQFNTETKQHEFRSIVGYGIVEVTHDDDTITIKVPYADDSPCHNHD